MLYIPTNEKINLEWSVKKGVGNEAEDFSRATVSLFLFSDENRWAVPCTADYAGVVRAELPETLPEGVYSLDLLWIKNDKSINETRCLQRTRKTHVFAIDASASPHQTRALGPNLPVVPKPGQPVTLKMETVAAPYGYDGLSAYEAAILYGMQINISEKEWAEILYNYEASEASRVEAENIRETNEDEREANEAIRQDGYYAFGRRVAQVEKEQEVFEQAVRNQVENYKPIVINGNVSNAADEEDITSDENHLLKLKDRNYLDGMGYVILRKNKSFQEQVKHPNTIYEVRYDFDLGTETVEMEDNCVLKFDGGSLRNGKIVLQNTGITGNTGIFKNLDVTGSSSSSIRSSWWDVSGESEANQTKILGMILNIEASKIFIESDFHVVNPNIEVRGKNNVLLDYSGSHIFVEKSDYTKPSPVTYRCLRLMESAHVTIRGMRATGDVLAQCNNPNFPAEGNLLCHGIDVYDCQNITIDDCIIDEMIGDSVQLGGNSHNKDIHITNCKFSSNRRQGISILCGSDIYIYNCTIKDIGKDIPDDIQDWGCGIDIEPWRGKDYVKNVIIDSCYIGNTKGQLGANISVIGTAFSDATESVVSDISITNCSCQGDIFIDTVLNTVVERCTLRCIKHRSGGINDEDIYYATVRASSLSRIYTDMKASYTIIEDCIIKEDKENNTNYTIWCQGKGVELYNTSILGHGKASYVRILTTQTAIIDNCRLDDERYVSTTEDKIEEWIRIDTTKDVRIVNSNFDLFYAIVFNDTGNTLVDNCTFAMKRWDDEGASLKEYAVHFRTRFFNTEKSSDDCILRNNRCKDCNYLYHFYSKTASSYAQNIFIANYILHDTANELVKPDPNPDPTDNTDGIYLKYQIAENSLRMTSQGIQIYKSWKWQYLNFTLSGVWKAKPVDPPIGTWYHCTDKKTAQDDGKGIMIRYVGDGFWADALGEVINSYYPKPKYGTYSQAISISKVVSGEYTYNLPPGSTFFCTDKKTSGDENSEGTLLIWTGTKWVDSTGAEVK